MAKTTELSVIDKHPESGDLVGENPEMIKSPTLRGFATEMNVDLDVSPAELVRQGAHAMGLAQRLNVAAGLALLAAKEKCEHGEFERYLAAHDIPSQRASEHMAITQLLLKASATNRKKLMQQSKTALIGLARADDAVLQHMLETGKLDGRLTLDEYDQLLGKKDEQITRLSTTNEKRLSQVKSHEYQGRKALDASTPLAIAQLRREAAGYAQDALANIHGFVALQERLQGLGVDAKAQGWVTPTSVSLVSLLQAVYEAAGQQLDAVIDCFGLDMALPEASKLQLATPGPEEAQMIRQAMMGVLVGVGQNHALAAHALYEEKRKKAAPLGRPRAKPVSVVEN